jgi:hypothetical protein
MKISFTTLLLLLISTLYSYSQTDTLRNEKIKYKPRRLYAGGQSDTKLTWVGVESEYRIIKNTLNLGLLANYGFPKGGGYYTFIAGAYLAPYIAMNRNIFNNYAKQNQGLFLFAKLGYGAYDVVVPDIGNTLAYGPLFGVGGDFLITPGFGVTVNWVDFTKSHDQGIVSGGIVVNF